MEEFCSRELRACTFDCFGTLIDWAAGLLKTLRPLAERRGLQVSDEQLLARFAEHERQAEAGPYQPYRSVLSQVARAMFGDEADADAIAAALGSWQPFNDTVGALQQLGTRFRLGVLSNVDDDLFEPVLETLGRPFEVVVTAQQVHSYKPGEAHFVEGLRRLNLDADEVLHVAESRFHDITPASRLGLHTAWVRRGPSASGPSDARADVEVGSLEELVNLLGLPQPDDGHGDDAPAAYPTASREHTNR